MLQNDTNRSLAGQVQSQQTQLFGGLTTSRVTAANPVAVTSAVCRDSVKVPAKMAMKPAASVHQPAKMTMSRTSNVVSMHMGSSSMSIMNSQPESTGFFGQPTQAPVATVRASALQSAAPSGGRVSNVQMFAGSTNQGMNTSAFQSSYMGTIGQQMSISKMPAAKATSRASAVVMDATASTEPATEQVTDSDYMDRVFLQQKYDNSDHLDPDLHYTGNQYVEELMKNAKLLSAPGKGILASDESNGTCGKRFEAIGIENTEKNRNDYREMLYTTKNLEQHVSGAIMYDETIRQSAKDGRTLVKVLADKGILTGIKVDTGISIIEGTNDETVTNGLDGLSTRASEYYEMGARFAKWRAVLKITPDGCPSDVAITETAHSLARYAQICQHAGLVPIVEPEILTDGEHDIKTCARVSEKVFNAVMNELITQ